MSFEYATKDRPIDICARRAGIDDAAPVRWFLRCQWVPGGNSPSDAPIGAWGVPYKPGHWRGLASGYIPTGWRERTA